MSSHPLSLGPIELGPIPRIAGILERALRPGEADTLWRAGVSVLEFRVDAFSDGPDAALAAARDAAGGAFGLLGTVRDTEWRGRERLPVFERLLEHVHCIDVEFEAPERADLAALARERGRMSLLSTHDFSRMPADDELQAVLDEARRLKTDLVKIAAFAQSRADLLRLLRLCEQTTDLPLIAIAMGPWGLFSRVAAPFYGSLLSYGFLDQANAPGQLSATELHSEFLRYHPEYAADSRSRS